jgi:bifunctional UDP-N-acetylglucosamine pyrophosphorylase/glucosamine-1-phosphate N-acetyltransferase
MSSTLQIAILAAGQGKRMRSALPKVLHPMAGRPLLEHVVASARELSPARICVVYGHGGERVRDTLAGAGLDWVRQEPQLGTGHAVRIAMPHLGTGGVTLILYGDVPLIRPATLRPLVEAAAAGALALLTVELDDPSGYGRIVRDREGRVAAIVEDKDATEALREIREVNTGILCVATSRLAKWLEELRNDNAQGEYYLTDIVALAVRDGCAVTTARPARTTEILGVNSKAQLAALERAYQAERAQELLEQGVTLADPARLDVRGSLQCGRDVVIDVNCVLEGDVRLDDNVTLEPNCVLRNVHVGAGTTIAAFSHVEDAVIGARCRIGPYARIRPGTALAEDVHIGNFVEVKNAEIGTGSKANHLAYVGDATVGRNVNVGAGTITCNYDGANKHRTVIEDDVFIGSDTQLVAPVTVRRGATLGAGTTLTREAPADMLTLSRARQTSIPGWKRPVKKTR